MRLDTVKWQVLQALERELDTRNSDALLFETVHKHFYGVAPTTPYMQVLKQIENGTIPPFETMRRSRQKIQEERAGLRAAEPIETARINKQLEYIEFASK